MLKLVARLPPRVVLTVDHGALKCGKFMILVTMIQFVISAGKKNKNHLKSFFKRKVVIFQPNSLSFFFAA